MLRRFVAIVPHVRIVCQATGVRFREPGADARGSQQAPQHRDCPDQGESDSAANCKLLVPCSAQPMLGNSAVFVGLLIVI